MYLVKYCLTVLILPQCFMGDNNTNNYIFHGGGETPLIYYWHRILGVIPSLIFTTSKDPYKQSFQGLSYGIVWYSKKQSARYKNLKIGFFRLTWTLAKNIITHIILFDKSTDDIFMGMLILSSLIPEITFLNIKYKRFEICFLHPFYILLAFICLICGYPHGGWFYTVLMVMPISINIDIS